MTDEKDINDNRNDNKSVNQNESAPEKLKEGVTRRDVLRAGAYTAAALAAPFIVNTGARVEASAK